MLNPRFLISATGIDRAFGVPPGHPEQKQLPPTTTVGFSPLRFLSLVVVIPIVYSGWKEEFVRLGRDSYAAQERLHYELPATHVFRNQDGVDMAVWESVGIKGAFGAGVTFGAETLQYIFPVSFP